LVQVTGGSLLGGFGRTAKSVATELMNRNLVHFIASDAHDTKYRTPALRDAYQYVEKTWGQTLAQTLFIDAPRAVLAGEAIELADPEPQPKKKWFRFGF
jgi:protein-tyrosine phosphatase